MDDLVDFGRKVLASQPFSVLLGAEIVMLDRGTAELAFNLVEKHKQQHGFAHGGAISYLADNALTFAGGMALAGPAVTAEMKINYVRPAIGERLIARAVAVHVGKNQSVCRCDIFAVKDGQEKLCAVALGTISRMASGTSI